MELVNPIQINNVKLNYGTGQRSEILAKFRKMIVRQPIIGGGAGTGLSAKWEEAGGIDP